MIRQYLEGVTGLEEDFLALVAWKEHEVNKKGRSWLSRISKGVVSERARSTRRLEVRQGLCGMYTVIEKTERLERNT